MTHVPYLDLKAQYQTIRREVLATLEAVCESTAFAQGPAAKQFETEFAAWCGVNECVGLNSGTSALHVALRCLDIGPGDEVITVPFTFVATVWAIVYVGAKPVFVDIDPRRRTLDPGQLEKAITSRTKAIIPVHLYGMPADMTAIMALANRHGIPVIEDAAQAHGARFQSQSGVPCSMFPPSLNDKLRRTSSVPCSPPQADPPSAEEFRSAESPLWTRCGSFGVMACFSFYPGKNLGAYGEGGALVTNDPALATRARRLREHGARDRYYHEEIGYNYRMDSFQGAVLSIKLRHLDAWNAARRERANRYGELLGRLPLTLSACPADSEPVWHCYVIEVDNRDRVREQLGARGVDTGLHYPVPLHLQKVFAALGHHRGDFPVAERLSERCLSLPIYPELTEAQQQAVAAALRAAV